MATWHITVKLNESVSFVPSPAFTQAISALQIKPFEQLFINHGFTVRPMPEASFVALTVSHTSESAITLFMLKYDVSCIGIQRIS